MCFGVPRTLKGDLAQKWAHLMAQGFEFSCLTSFPGQAGSYYLLAVPLVFSH